MRRIAFTAEPTGGRRDDFGIRAHHPPPRHPLQLVAWLVITLDFSTYRAEITLDFSTYRAEITLDFSVDPGILAV